ncbi:hypothetical protein M758_4G115500, partial [Ceratodon purpureus]
MRMRYIMVLSSEFLGTPKQVTSALICYHLLSFAHLLICKITLAKQLPYNVSCSTASELSLVKSPVLSSNLFVFSHNSLEATSASANLACFTCQRGLSGHLEQGSHLLGKSASGSPATRASRMPILMPSWFSDPRALRSSVGAI